MKRKRIFVSSVQRELAAERAALRAYRHDDPLLHLFFDFFLFEDLPASGRRPDEVYLKEVAACDVYIGIFGHEYGAENAVGRSPTEREFLCATELGKPRLIYVKGTDDKTRHPKRRALIQKAVKTLFVLSENPSLSLSDVAAPIGKSLSAVERASAKLVKDGKLRIVGPRKGGHWEVLK